MEGWMEKWIKDYIILRGQRYNVDREQKVLTGKGDQLSQIPFSSLQRDGPFYTLDMKSISRDKQENLIKIKIPAAFLDSREIVGEIFVSQMNQKSYREGWHALFFDREILNRLTTVNKPIIDLAGNRYEVDVSRMQINPLFIGKATIKLEDKEGEEGKGLTGRSFWYNKNTWEEVDLDFRATRMPDDDIYLVSMKSTLVLDPIGVAAKYGMEVTSLLDNYPVQSFSTAKSIPLSETSFPEVIRRNQISQEKQVKKPEDKPNKGKLFRRWRPK